MGRQLPDLNCQYGAPLGRADVKTNVNAKARLFRVRLDSGGYDDGGAYWGVVIRGENSPLYCAKADGLMLFRRAKDRNDAKKQIQESYPGLTFYR